MAKLYYATADGSPVSLTDTDAMDAAAYPNGGPAGTSVLAFDEATNGAVLDSLKGRVAGFDWADHAVVGGVLKRKGVAVPVAADGPTKSDLDGLLSGAAAAVSGNTTYLAIASPSNAQVAAQVRALTQQTNAVIKRLVLLNRLKG